MQFCLGYCGRWYSKITCSWKDAQKEGQLMIVCNKCDNEHHDQCMGKAGMFDCGCKCFKK